jgi:hypothetical protein
MLVPDLQLFESLLYLASLVVIYKDLFLSYNFTMILYIFADAWEV